MTWSIHLAREDRTLASTPGEPPLSAPLNCDRYKQGDRFTLDYFRVRCGRCLELGWDDDAQKFPVGTRVRAMQAVERYPHFRVDAGATGVIVDESSELPAGAQSRMLGVKVDQPVKGCEEWGNVVLYGRGDGTLIGGEWEVTAPPPAPDDDEGEDREEEWKRKFRAEWGIERGCVAPSKHASSDKVVVVPLKNGAQVIIDQQAEVVTIHETHGAEVDAFVAIFAGEAHIRYMEGLTTEKVQEDIIRA